MPSQFDFVQIVADNTDVFSGRIGVPPNARKGTIYVIAPDTDWTFDLSINNKELARDTACTKHQADNLATVEITDIGIDFDVERRGPDFDILLDINVVTAGVGLAGVVWRW